MRRLGLALSLLLIACGSREEPRLEDLPVVELDEPVTRRAAPNDERPALTSLGEDDRPWARSAMREGRTLLGGGFFSVREAGGSPPRLRVGRAADALGEIDGELLLDPATGRVLADVPELGRWMPRAGVFFRGEPSADGTLALRRATDGQTFTVTLRLPDGATPASALVAGHPDADRVWLRGADASGVTWVAPIDAPIDGLGDATVTLSSRLPGPPGLARFDGAARTFEVVIPGAPGGCAYARFGEDGCLRRGTWEGAGGMAEIPLGDGWLLVDQRAVARAAAEEPIEPRPLDAGCPGFSLVGALSDPPRVAYQCMEASPPVVRAWSPDASIEVAYPEGRAASRFFPLDLRAPVLMGPPFDVDAPRARWIDLRRMRALEGPALLSVDTLLAEDERYLGVRPEGGLVVVDLEATSFSDVPDVACGGLWSLVARGGGRVAVGCSDGGEARGAVILEPARRRLFTTEHRVEAVLPDGTVLASDRRGDANDRARRLFTLEVGE